MQFICYPKCTTCQKARKWLDANGVAYDERHIKTTTRLSTSWKRGTNKAACRSSGSLTPAGCNTRR